MQTRNFIALRILAIASRLCMKDLFIRAEMGGGGGGAKCLFRRQKSTLRPRSVGISNQFPEVWHNTARRGGRLYPKFRDGTQQGKGTTTHIGVGDKTRSCAQRTEVLKRAAKCTVHISQRHAADVGWQVACGLVRILGSQTSKQPLSMISGQYSKRTSTLRGLQHHHYQHQQHGAGRLLSWNQICIVRV